MYKICSLSKKRAIGIPGRFYSYLALCRKVMNTKNPDNQKIQDLPFIAKFAEKSTFQGVRHICWDFLKY